MYEEDPKGPDHELDRLTRKKRKVYITVMILAVGALVCAWIFRSSTDPHRTISVPIYIFALLTLVAALWRERVPLARVETLMLVILSAMPLSRQAWLFFLGAPANEEWLRLLGNTYWATSGVLVIVCMISDRRRGLATGVGLVLASVLIAVVGIGVGLETGQLPRSVIAYVVGSLLFLTVFLVLISGATIMRDQWQSALGRAKTYSRLAMTDKLTGLGNRRAAIDALERLCTSARKNGMTFSVILGDLDGFKQVNDSRGHAVGDAVLVEVSKRLRATIRDGDAVTRWGGEEFLIVASRSRLDGARQLAERCRSTIETAPFTDGIRITMTFGVAEFQPGDSQETLLARADANLYTGKRADRNRVEATANPNMVLLPGNPGR